MELALAAAAIQGLLAAVLAVAGVGKARNVAAFATVIAAHRLLPTRLVLPFAVAIVTVELLLSAMLLLGIALFWTALAVAGLLLVFDIALVRLLLQGRSDAPCGCFGASSGTRVSYAVVFRNLVLVSLAITLAYMALSGIGTPAVIVFAATIGAVIVFLVVSGLHAMRQLPNADGLAS